MSSLWGKLVSHAVIMVEFEVPAQHFISTYDRYVDYISSIFNHTSLVISFPGGAQ